MSTIWSRTALEQLIKEQRLENQYLEYKSADSLSGAESKKTDISKDVSAMANASGGVIIYGIREKQDNKNVPEGIDPIDQAQYSKEWLANVISDNIQPRIEGLLIHPIHVGLGSDHFVYVVEIPQSTTAHQARDNRYYSRYNSKIQPMTDSQIRDVMGRNQHPQIELTFQFRNSRGGLINEHELIITAHNRGRIYAHYVNCVINLPTSLLTPKPDLFDRHQITIEGKQYHIIQHANTHRDTIEQWTGGDAPQKYRSLGPTWFKPILPGMHHQWIHALPSTFKYSDLPLEDSLHWQIYADNAPPMAGTIFIKDIPLTTEIETTKSVIIKKFKRHRTQIVTAFTITAIMVLCLLFLLVVLPKLMPGFTG